MTPEGFQLLNCCVVFSMGRTGRDAQYVCDLLPRQFAPNAQRDQLLCFLGQLTQNLRYRLGVQLGRFLLPVVRFGQLRFSQLMRPPTLFRAKVVNGQVSGDSVQPSGSVLWRRGLPCQSNKRFLNDILRRQRPLPGVLLKRPTMLVE